MNADTLRALIARWREPITGGNPAYQVGRDQCADELEAALAQQPLHEIACENCQNGRDCARWDCAAVAALADPLCVNSAPHAGHDLIGPPPWGVIYARCPGAVSLPTASKGDE